MLSLGSCKYGNTSVHGKKKEKKTYQVQYAVLLSIFSKRYVNVPILKIL